MSDYSEIIDVHCHLFNSKYMLMELAAFGWNYMRGDYPHQKKSLGKRVERRGIISELEGFKDLVVHISKFIKVILSDCDENYMTLIREFDESNLGQGKSIIIAPLMMDIYFSLYDNKDEEEAGKSGRRTTPVIEAFVIPENQKADFDDYLQYLKNVIKEEIETQPSVTGRRSISGKEIDSIFQDIGKELADGDKSSRRSCNYDGIELSPGYKKHMEDLEELCKKYPDRIFPFLAVDPRRKGIMDLIEKKVGDGSGMFKGIKIYTPLGYLPTHPDLKPVFEYCSKHDIPVTTHCSKGGMPNFRKKNYVSSWIKGDNSHWEEFDSLEDRSIYYADPEKWLPVLEEFNNLRINFAHFGGIGKADKDNEEIRWADTIIEMMKVYPNIYTDMSYFTNEEVISKINEKLEKNEVLKTRLMFGTDFVMIMLDMHLKGLENYFNSFYNKFDDNILSENAKRFLKIK